jgi:hypothetical protein
MRKRYASLLFALCFVAILWVFYETDSESQ